jgi:threonylcarbamoyladenosine tRNA methylthiotransferase MtaB
MATFAIKTLGCKVNQYESQALREKLLGLGFSESEDSRVDVYVVNTCAVTEKADRGSLDTLRQLNRRNPQAKIFVTGCSAQNNPGAIKSINGIAGVLKNDEKERLPDFVSGMAPARKSEPSTITVFHRHSRAFLKIQDGCNNRCSYCIIPKLRGASRSRPMYSIIDEAKKLAENGYKEIVLCGICLGSYGKDIGMSEALARLTEALEKIEGLARIRLSSIEASEVSSELINHMTTSEKLCRHLHIPLQSADEKVLTLMRRKVTPADYAALVFQLRRRLPDIGITTDVMVGFPGEEEANFANTLKFLEEIKPSRMHIFPFSPRKKTPAYNFANTVKPHQMKERLSRMKALSKKLSLDFCSLMLGEELSVLVESVPCPKTGLLKGYSSNYIRTYLPQTQHIANTIVRAKPLKTFRDGVFAELSQ